MELADVQDFIDLQLNTDKQLLCIQCNNPREKGRRYCRNCYLENKRKYAKERYLKNGSYNIVQVIVEILQINMKEHMEMDFVLCIDVWLLKHWEEH